MNILSLLRALSHRNIRGGRRPGRTPIRKRAPYRPRIEPLEDRSMLSSILMLPLDDGTFQLRIEGDAKPNQVAIVGRGPGDLNNDYSLMVTCDQLQQTVNNVSEVFIDTRGGADTVLLNGLWAGVRSISADLGGDGDAFNFDKNTVIGSLEVMDIRGGPGDDKVSVMNNTFAGTVTFYLELNGGNDVATMHDNLFSGDLNLTVTGDAGQDVLLVECGTIAGSFDTSVDLGKGGDTATFTELIVTGLWQLTVNGGDGDDVVDIGGENDEGTMAGNQIGGGLVQKVNGGDGNDVVAFHGNFLEPSGINNGDALPAYLVGMLLGKGEDAAIVDGNTFGDSLNLSAIGGVGGSAFVDLGPGDDTATFAENTLNGVWKTTFKGDSGNDVVSSFNNIFAGSPEYFVDLDKGDDTAMFAGNTVIGSLLMTVLGGDGRDLVTVEGECIGGPFDLLVDLGDGNDRAKVEFKFVNQDPAQQKPITVRVLGGKGDDDLTLTVKGDPEVLAAANLLIDGGSGFDHGMSGPFVKIYNCEQ